MPLPDRLQGDPFDALGRSARLVTDRPDGARRLYRLSDEGADSVRSYMTSVWGEAAAQPGGVLPGFATACETILSE